MLNLVLYAPRIPQNTGQLARACWAMNCRLHLIRPLGFRMDAAALKRAAVGYIAEMDIPVYANADEFWKSLDNPKRVWLVSKFGRRPFTEVEFQDGDYLLMGNEDEGLPREWLEKNADQTISIPMPNHAARCLNLATAATAVMFEALRQIGNPATGE